MLDPMERTLVPLVYDLGFNSEIYMYVKNIAGRHVLMANYTLGRSVSRLSSERIV